MYINLRSMFARRRFDGNWRVSTLRALIYLHSVIVNICEEILTIFSISRSKSF